MKFSFKNASEFGWEGLKGKAYNSQRDFENASAAYFEVTGSHGKAKTTRSDRIYLVLDGHGEFIIDDREIPVEKNDVVIVPRNTPYDYRSTKGVLKLFLVHTPSYNPDFEIKT